MPKRTPLTDAEREQRRAADRAFVQQAVDALRSSEGRVAPVGRGTPPGAFPSPRQAAAPALLGAVAV